MIQLTETQLEVVKAEIIEFNPSVEQNCKYLELKKFKNELLDQQWAKILKTRDSKKIDAWLEEAEWTRGENILW